MSRRDQITEVLHRECSSDDCAGYCVVDADALMPLVDRLCAEAAAEALEQAASDFYSESGPENYLSTATWLRARAAATPPSKEQQP